MDVARLGITGRALGVEYLNSVNPALLNVISLGAPSQAYYHDQFNDNYVFRDGPPVVNSVPGAIAIQGAFEAAEWLGILGDPLGYAQHLNAAPLNGVPPKSVLFQFGYGDLEVPNPTESAVIRAAGTQNPGWFFHFEEAAGADPNLLGIGVTTDGFPILPHRILSNETTFEFPSETSIAVAEQQQVASYFAGDGRTNPDPNAFLTGIFSGNTGLFQDPSPLPNQVNFLQIRP